MTLIELTVSTVIVGVLATVSYATISPKLKEDAQITEVKAHVRKYAIDNQYAIMTGTAIEIPPNSQNFGYSISTFDDEKFIVAKHLQTNAEIFASLKNSGSITLCKNIEDCPE
ncbi:MAG: type II secretion system protein [Candidatus Nanopelagicaceae bacterium]